MSDVDVPQGLRHLLPYASLVTTGEELLLEKFLRVMDEQTRAMVNGLISQRISELEEFGRGFPQSDTRYAFMDLVRLTEIED